MRKFYASYYFSRKAGEVISCIFCLSLVASASTFFKNHDFDGFYTVMVEGWACFILISSSLAFIPAMIGEFLGTTVVYNAFWRNCHFTAEHHVNPYMHDALLIEVNCDQAHHWSERLQIHLFIGCKSIVSAAKY